MPDDGFDGGPAAHFSLDVGRHRSLLAGDEHPELVIGRRIVATVSPVGEMRAIVLPTSTSMSGITVASV
ncbi:hypothetical protein IVB08_16530 [Bradyrhizobium sp. 173]|nr:hypothetical protein [Bradyrhizobium sp. 173]